MLLHADEIYDLLEQQQKLLESNKQNLNRQLANLGRLKVAVYPLTTLAKKYDLPWDTANTDPPRQKTRCLDKPLKEPAEELPWNA